VKIIAQNKKVYHDYEILDKVEAGIVLTGDEVKSLRAGMASLTGSFATIHEGELFLVNCHITPYAKAFRKDEEAARKSRKLLLHKRELDRLIGEISRRGVTVVPLKLYFSDKNIVKVELGIARHKKAARKKQVLKEKDIERQTQRELRGRYKY
jgi:SsrA-binding protein